MHLHLPLLGAVVLQHNAVQLVEILRCVHHHALLLGDLALHLAERIVQMVLPVEERRMRLQIAQRHQMVDQLLVASVLLRSCRSNNYKLLFN